MKLQTPGYKVPLLLFVFLTTFMIFSMEVETTRAQVSDSQGQQEQKKEGSENKKSDENFCKSNPELFRDSMVYTGIAETVLLVIVLLVLPLHGRRGNQNASNSRGLGLPSGSIRGMIALLVIGSMVNFLLFMGPCLGKDRFDSVLDTFTTVSVAVIAFYFANRSSTNPPPNQ